MHGSTQQRLEPKGKQVERAVAAGASELLEETGARIVAEVIAEVIAEAVWLRH